MLPLLLGSACGALQLSTPAPPRSARLCDGGCPLTSLRSGPQAKLAPPKGVLHLRQALRLALQHNPDLAVIRRERNVRLAEARGAGEYPNPAVHVDVEDWLGSGDMKWARSLQVTVQVSQEIELGNQRAARMQVARIAQRAAAWTYAVGRLRVLAATTRAFIDVLHAQARLALVREQLSLTGHVLKSVSDRADAGRILPAEVAQARILVSLAEMKLRKLKRALVMARQALAAQWGARTAEFAQVVGRLDRLPGLPQLSTLMSRLEHHPRLQQHLVAIAHRRATMDLERRSAYPNLSVRLGYRWLNGSRDSAMVVGISVPLPFFSRNRGAVAAARQRFLQAKVAREAVRLRALVALKRAYQQLASARDEAKTLGERVVPTARSTVAQLQEGYRLGRVQTLTLLAAQQTLVDVRERHLAALLKVHEAVVTVKQLAGDTLTEDAK